MVLAINTGQSVMFARLGRTVVITLLEGPWDAASASRTTYDAGTWHIARCHSIVSFAHLTTA